MDCKECKVERQTVPYIVHEGMMARQERTIKRLWIALLLVIALLFASNLAWIIYESQYEDQYAEADVDTGNGDAVVAGIGDVNYGEGASKSAD